MNDGGRTLDEYEGGKAFWGVRMQRSRREGLLWTKCRRCTGSRRGFGNEDDGAMGDNIWGKVKPGWRPGARSLSSAPPPAMKDREGAKRGARSV